MPHSALLRGSIGAFHGGPRFPRCRGRACASRTPGSTTPTASNLLAAPAARLNLSLVELLRGRLIPTGVVLVSPTVTVDVDRPPFAGAGGSTGPGTAARSALAPLASLRLSDGLLRLVSARRGLDTTIDNVHGRFDGLTIGDQLRFNLSATWRNTPITVAGALNDPESAAKGAPSPVVFGLNSPLAKLSFRGLLALGDRFSADGDLTTSIPSVAALAAFLDTPALPALAANDIAITAKVKGAPNSLTLGDATLTSADQTLEGALAISDTGGRPVVSGTLAAETLALKPLLGPPERIFDPTGGWSTTPFAVAPPVAFDLDLRLSAAHLDLYGLPVADAAASVIVADGKLTIILIDATAYGGRLKGEVDAGYAGRDVKASVRGELVDADLGAAIADFSKAVMTGNGRAQFAVEASGGSPAAMVEPHRNGLARSGRWLHSGREPGGGAAPQSPSADRRGARHARRRNRVDKIDASLALEDGRARVERAVMTSHGVTAELRGLIDLLARSWDLHLKAVQTDAAGEESQDAAHLTVTSPARGLSRPSARPARIQRNPAGTRSPTERWPERLRSLGPRLAMQPWSDLPGNKRQ